MLFIDPEGVLLREPKNASGLNDGEIQKLLKLVSLLGPDIRFVLMTSAAHRELGLTDGYYKALKDAGLPFIGIAEPEDVKVNLSLVGADAVDTETYKMKKMKANRCAEIRTYMEQSSLNTDEFAIIQAWGGDLKFGSIPPKLEDEELQSYLVQCTEGINVVDVYRYFSRLSDEKA